MILRLAELRVDLEPLAPAIVGAGGDLDFDGVVTDSRSEVAGRLFFALAGERFDGHDFVPDVLARGARGVVVRRAALGGAAAAPVAIGVDDPLLALQQVAHASLVRVRPTVVAITGSNGKTTTKDLTLAALATLGPVHGTRGNLNNHIGVPLTVLARRGDEKFLVAEAGANDFGELELLSRLLEPDAVIITNIGRAHLEKFGSQAGVVRAKAELFHGLRPGGIAILNADDPFFPELVERAGPAARIASVGFASSAAYRIESARAVDAGRQELVVNGVRCTLARPGQGNARNAAAALALATELGGDLRLAAAALADAVFTGGRSAWIRRGDLEVLDDTYNANPDSMAQALELLAAHPGRRIAVLGDMLELGGETAALHARLGAEVAGSNIDWFLALGPQMEHAVESARAAGMGERARHFATLEALVAALHALLVAGDAILVKGSRGSRMERVVAALGAGVV